MRGDMNVRSNAQKLIKGATGDWEVVIGMEIHAQVTSESKLFSGASTEFGGAPNSHVSLVDAAMPGMLPVINEECVRQVIRTGLGLKAKVNLRSVFDRKNYFYPDLPQGYQISQYKSPIVGEGAVAVDLEDGSSRRRNELVTTKIEEKAIAAAASHGALCSSPATAMGMSIGPLSSAGKKTLLAITKRCRFPRFLSQVPRILSDSPSLYVFEVSKKLPPASTKQSASACDVGSSALQPKVWQPSIITETLTPVRPTNATFSRGLI